MNERDQQIHETRQGALLKHTTPQVGDVIRFNDGKYARMAHVWDEDIQPTLTLKSGSFYLGNGMGGCPTQEA